MSAGKHYRVGAVIVASGPSTRMHGVDKISTNLAGKPLIQWSLECFERSNCIDEIALVLSSQNIALGRKLIRENHMKKVKICLGGLQRQDSTKAGLHDLHKCDFVVVHDGARPCINEKLLHKSIFCAFNYGSAVPATKLTDALKRVLNEHKNTVHCTLDKAGILAVQTPQVFQYDILKRAFEAKQEGHTNLSLSPTSAVDESQLVEWLGEEVKLFIGPRDNIKVTEKFDLMVAEQILLSRQHQA